jgi:hypothetical protein
MICPSTTKKAMAVVVVAVAVVLLSVSASPPAAAQPWQYCGSGARYSPNSTYQANLEAVSAELPCNASSSPALFATAARGAGDDRVFAMTLCRGDADAAGCLDCVTDAFRHARGSCPLDKEVAVLYDACFLYFSGQDFFAANTTVGQISLYNTPQNASADPCADALFTARVRALLNSTARWAAYGSARRFATARIWNGSVAAPVPTMYALAQCKPDLSPADCWDCLEDLVGKAPLAGGMIGARTAGVRCSYRYENYVFFRGVPMLNMGTPPPPSTQPPAGRRSGASLNRKFV